MSKKTFDCVLDTHSKEERKNWRDDMYENIDKALFGFKDKEAGDKLRVFFKKHTGIDVDFNAIKHYEDGFKLLLFSIPLGKISTLGITCANGYPARKFTGPVQEFIDWYEKDYLVFKNLK